MVAPVNIPKGNIHLITRYNRDDIITSIEDFLDVAYDWDYHYCRKDSIYGVCGVSAEWKALYLKYGYDVFMLK